ncbi:MAG: class I SAM-dependent methyltransferase [Acidimicrobiia bacterium]
MGDDFVLSRLLGDVAKKRVLELGCGDGTRAVELARAGATLITVDPDAAAVLGARQRAEAAEVRIEVHTGDFADLAFLRGDSVDVVFAEDSLAAHTDLDRVLRQVQRVLRAGAWFAFSLPHPFGALVETEPEATGSLPLARPFVGRSYFDDDPVDGDRPHRIGDVFTSLGRVGFRVDLIVEPEPPATARGRALVPTTVIWRARKLGS